METDIIGVDKFFATEVNLFMMIGWATRMCGIANMLVGLFVFGELAFKYVGSVVKKRVFEADLPYILSDFIGKSLLIWAYIPVVSSAIAIFGILEWATRPNVEVSKNLARAYTYVNSGLYDIDYNADGTASIYVKQGDGDNPVDKWSNDAFKDLEGNGAVDLKTANSEDVSEDRKEQKLPEFSLFQLFDRTIFQRLFQVGFSTAAGLINGLSMLVIKGLISALVSIFFLMGPFAIAFSTLGFFKDKINTWVGRFAGVLGTYVTFNFIMIVQDSNFIAPVFGSSGDMAGETMTMMGSLALNLSTIILNLLVFWLTSTWVGSSDSGKVLSTASAAGTFAGAKILGAFGGGGGMKGSSMSDVTNMSKKAGGGKGFETND